MFDLLRQQHSQWPEDRVETLRKLHAEGYSGGVIADKLGTSRSAVIGKLHRLGLSRKTTQPMQHIRKKTGPRGMTPEQRAETGKKISQAMRSGRPETLRNWSTKPEATARRDMLEAARAMASDDQILPLTTWDQRQRHECQWIPGEPKHDAPCCGRPVVAGLPYCTGHALRAYTPEQPKSMRRLPAIGAGVLANVSELLDA